MAQMHPAAQPMQGQPAMQPARVVYPFTQE